MPKWDGSDQTSEFFAKHPRNAVKGAKLGGLFISGGEG